MTFDSTTAPVGAEARRHLQALHAQVAALSVRERVWAAQLVAAQRNALLAFGLAVPDEVPEAAAVDQLFATLLDLMFADVAEGVSGDGN